VPPAAGTVQMSPPETKAISRRSGEIAGSVKYGAGFVCAATEKAVKKTKQRFANKLKAKDFRDIYFDFRIAKI
jgi:hypothetical protein